MGVERSPCGGCPIQDRAAVCGSHLTWEGEEDPDLGRPLRVQVVRDPGDILRPPVLREGVPVESLYDIAVEKLAAVSDRHELKQYVDLYFIGKRPGYRVSETVLDLPRKQGGIHLLMLAIDLEQVSEALIPWDTFLPWFLVAPPEPSEIERYFNAEAERVRNIAEAGI